MYLKKILHIKKLQRMFKNELIQFHFIPFQATQRQFATTTRLASVASCKSVSTRSSRSKDVSFRTTCSSSPGSRRSRRKRGTITSSINSRLRHWLVNSFLMYKVERNKDRNKDRKIIVFMSVL